jgi:transcription elongation factor Elf1
MTEHTDDTDDVDGADGYDDTLRCPACGELLEGDAGDVPTSIDDGEIRVAVDCPACGAPLEIVIESALPEALGVDVTVEPRG